MIYRKEVDGLRAVAVLPVIMYHAGFEIFSGGYIGVDVFFVISGYLITSIILNERQENNFSLINFYERRARRILPPLFFVLLLCLPFAWSLMPPDKLKDFSQSLTSVTLFSSNILFWLESSYFAPGAEMKPLLHTWSLAVEEQYYVFFPLLILGLWGVGKQKLMGVVILLALISLMFAEWGSVHAVDANFYLIPSRAWELFLGSMVAFYLKERSFTNTKYHALFEGLGLVLILYSIFWFDSGTPFPSFYTLVPTVGTALIIIFSNSKTLVGRFLSNPLFVGIGLVSYSAYLWHQPLFTFARLSSVSEPKIEVMLLLCALTFGFAYISWKFVERPFRNKEKFTRKEIFSIAIIANFIFALVGVSGHLKNGFPDRVPLDISPTFLTTLKNSSLNYGTNGETCGGSGLYICLNNDVESKGNNFLLVGDSHSQDFGRAYYNFLDAENFRGYQMSIYGCSFVKSRFYRHEGSCGEARMKLPEIIIEKEIKNLIFVAGFDLYTDDYSREKRNEDTSDFVSMIAELSSNKDINIFLFLPRKAMKKDLVNFLMIANFANKIFPESNDEDENWLAWRKAFNQVNESPNVHLFDERGFVCELGGEKRCGVITPKNQIPIYKDKNHLTQYAAWKVFENFQSEFLSNF